MKVKDMRKGAGPPIPSTTFNRWDSFEPGDGPHVLCKTRIVVYGMGRRITVVDGVQESEPALLLRCQGCRQSFVI